jgi:hypothetical protein
MSMGLMLLLSCSEEQSQERPISPPASKPISMSVLVSPSVIRFAESATVLLSLSNDSPDEVSLDFKCQDPFGYVIKAESGSFTFSSIPVCFAPPHTIVLDVGETRTIAMPMTATLAPMTYDVSAGMMEYADEYPWVSTKLTVRPIGTPPNSPLLQTAPGGGEDE